MKVMVMVKATPSSERGELPSEQLLTEMGQYNAELVKAGIMQAGEGLKPSSAGARVLFSGTNRTVTDGPFAEMKELVAGFWLWQVKSLEDAIEWVKRCPNPMLEDSEIEIRPLYEMEDFAEQDPDGKIAADEEVLKAEMEKYALEPPRIEKIEQKTIAGLNETYTFETRMNIPEQWCSFMSRVEELSDGKKEATFGVCWNYVPGTGFDYLSGAEVANANSLPDGMSSVTLSAGRYLVFTHTKHVSEIPNTIEAIWQKYLPNSSYAAGNSPSFERYTDEFDVETGFGGTEIRIPLAD